MATLRHGLVSGRLGTDTFIERVESAYSSKTHDQLAALTDDLPRARRPWRLALERWIERGRRLPRLRPPPMRDGERRAMGRDRSSDFAIPDPTVSLRHAELVRTTDGWLIHDLGSRNGTRVNGWLVREERLEPGDVIELGSAAFEFSPRAGR